MWSCTQARLSVDSHGDLKLGSDADRCSSNRYFGFHSYGGAKRSFKNERRPSPSTSRRVTDIPFSCGRVCRARWWMSPSRTTPMRTTWTASGKTVRYVPANKLDALAAGHSRRRRLVHPVRVADGEDGRRLLGAGRHRLLAQLHPPRASPTSACRLTGAGDTGRSWQADVITGLPDQSDGFRLPMTRAAARVPAQQVALGVRSSSGAGERHLHVQDGRHPLRGGGARARVSSPPPRRCATAPT